MLRFLVLFAILALSMSFGVRPTSRSFLALQRSSNRIDKSKFLSMEYIPDGLTKEQWAAMKKKEEEAQKKADLGKVGITKFKSRSFEAWQKGGQKHLFPVDPSTPLEKRPYMQRTGGSADGEDLKKMGLKGIGQGSFFNRNDADERYEKLEKEGKLKSTTFSVPWTASAAEKLAKERAAANKEARTATTKAVGAKKTTAVKGKATVTVKEAEPAPKKKGFFGLF